jgi:hypothetical protein
MLSNGKKNYMKAFKLLWLMPLFLLILISVISVNATGENDKDGDGVINDIDNCDDDPGPATNLGCPEITVTPAGGTGEGRGGGEDPTPEPTAEVTPTVYSPPPTPTPVELADCPADINEKIKTLPPELLEKYLADLPSACVGLGNLVIDDPIDIEGLDIDKIAADCPEKMPWLIHNAYRKQMKDLDSSQPGETAAAETSSNTTEGNPCDEPQYGRHDKAIVKQCLQGENITGERVKRILDQLAQFGISLAQVDATQLCQVILRVSMIGYATPEQTGFYNLLGTSCPQYPIGADTGQKLHLVWRMIKNATSLAAITEKLQSDTAQYCENPDALIDDGTPDLKDIPDPVKICKPATIQLYRNHVLNAEPPVSEAVKSSLLCQPNVCGAVVLYARYKFAPAICTNGDQPSGNNQSSGGLGGDNFIPEDPAIDFNVDAVLAAEDTTQSEGTDIFAMNYRPYQLPRVMQLVDTPNFAENFPALNIDGSYVAFLRFPVDALDQPPRLVVRGLTQTEVSGEVEVIPNERMLELQPDGFEPVAGAIAWDGNNNMIMGWRDTSTDLVHIYLYPFNIWRDPLESQALRLLIPTAKNPAISGSTEHGLLIAYEDTDETRLLKWHFLETAVDKAFNANDPNQFIGYVIPNTQECRTPVFGRNSLLIFFICSENGSESIYQYDIETGGEKTLVWSSNEAGVTLNSLDAGTAEDVLSFNIVRGENTTFYFYDVRNDRLIENDLLAKIQPFSGWKHRHLLFFTWGLRLN